MYNPTLNSLLNLHLHFYSPRLRIHLVFNNTRIIRYNKQTNQFNLMPKRIKLPQLKINLILIHHIIIRNRHNLIRRRFQIMVGVLRIIQAQAFKATKLINIPILNKILKNMLGRSLLLIKENDIIAKFSCVYLIIFLSFIFYLFYIFGSSLIFNKKINIFNFIN